MYKYLRLIPDGGALADFREVSPGTPVCVATKAQDHHAKVHIHLLSDEDPHPVDLMKGLLARHEELRFTLYYEEPNGYGTMHGKLGKLEKHVYKFKA